MAGGWFFLMICESFVLGDKDFRLPGLGSYMHMAVEKGDTAAMAWAVTAMITMIVALDQLVWRPVVVWAQKFRVEEGGHTEEMSSWFLDILQRSKIVGLVEKSIRYVFLKRHKKPTLHPEKARRKNLAFHLLGFLPPLAITALAVTLATGAWKLAQLVGQMPSGEWLDILAAAGMTLGRVIMAILLGTLWALPCGIAIGASPRLSRMLQPVVQIAASFPAPMLFPAVIALMLMMHIPLGWGSIILMLMGTQWYILFNIIAGTMAIPADLREAAQSYRLRGWQKFRQLYFPAVLPYLVTGWVTAAGGAWNASIVAEYVSYQQKTLTTFGLGAQISTAAEQADFPRLAAAVLVMSAVVVLVNRTLWQRLYTVAHERFSINR
jgi:NitT/TauT family transport system permease protein